MGTKQFVVHEALETTKSRGRVELVVVDPDHEGGVGVARAGAEMITRLAARLRWAAAVVPGGEAAGRLDHHVDPELGPRAAASGSRSASTATGPIAHQQVVALHVDRHRRAVPGSSRSARRWARVSAEVRSLTATTSTSAPVSSRPQVVAADAPEAVDSDPHRHLAPLLLLRSGRTCPGRPSLPSRSTQGTWAPVSSGQIVRPAPVWPGRGRAVASARGTSSTGTRSRRWPSRSMSHTTTSTATPWPGQGRHVGGHVEPSVSGTWGRRLQT